MHARIVERNSAKIAYAHGADRGGVLVELALICPLFLFILLPFIINVFGSLSEQTLLNHVARMVAREAVAGLPSVDESAPPTSVDFPAEFTTHVQNLAGAYAAGLGLNAVNLRVTVSNVEVSPEKQFLRLSITKPRFDAFGSFGFKICSSVHFPILMNSEGRRMVFGETAGDTGLEPLGIDGDPDC